MSATQDIVNGGFEGPEKLLEIWFECSSEAVSESKNGFDSDGSSTKVGLRSIEKDVWMDVLSIVKCKILNIIENDYMDAFLLSESSMFIYPHKLILKTCGTTTLLTAIPRLLEIATERCKLSKVWRVFYSRKSFMFPERQPHPHKDWKDEIAYLDQYFDRVWSISSFPQSLQSLLQAHYRLTVVKQKIYNGAAYIVGKINGDHWCLYLTSPQGDLTIGSSISPQIPDFPIIDNLSDPTGYSKGECNHSDLDDQTIEILMSNLGPETIRKFYYNPTDCDVGTGCVRINQETGLINLYPSAQLDSYLFKPCGYSANGLLEENYFTIHVTPEPNCSYASFETNIPVVYGKISSLIQQVISIFDPGNFTVTIFKTQGGNIDTRYLVSSLSNVLGYIRKDKILYEFDGYDLIFGHFEKK
ncbi:10456_t:CDS:2 [Acaulospora morrowiae]|uniref:adenosylmethionine decarboxylase n=1 Tax=Acaulospora morrowiae TaxID=94023 RepID=A0A9N9AQ58_9GLOM|nr:10456_t:CDS:2 [Acaulospora morrowiae]